MSKSRKQIIVDAFASNGLEVKRIKWTPLGKALEMCGPSGGWEVEIDEDKTPIVDGPNHNPVTGYNHKEVMDSLGYIKRTFDICPKCNHELGYYEAKKVFCNECSTDLNKYLHV